MNKKDVLINEYKELTLFRERSIHSIESSVNTYLTFLGLLLTALTILLGKYSIKAIPSNIFNISIGVGIIFFLYGFRTFRLIYISHENLVIYTRQLNITRNNLVGRNNKLGEMVFLPRCWQHVQFDRFGHEKVKFSKIGTSDTVKKINSLVISILLIVFLFQFVKEKLSTCWYWLFFLSVFFVSSYIHDRWVKNEIKSSKKRWNNTMKSEKYPEYLEE